MSENQNSLIKKNELEANYFVAKVMRITAVFLLLVLVLNIVGVFIIDMVPMVVSCIIGFVLLLVPTLMVNILKLDTPLLKYIAVTIAVTFVTILTLTLNWHAVIIYIFAIGIATMYFDKGVNIYAAVLSVIVYSIAQVIAYKLGFTNDENQTDMYYVLVYCVVPRALGIVSMSALFLSLNTRTRKMLNTLLDVDEQARMMRHLNAMKEKSLQVSKNLVNAVATLSVVTDNTKKNNEQIAQKTDVAAGGSNRTLNELNEVENNVSSISSNLLKLASGTDEIAGISENVQKLTTNNADNMKHALEGFVEISKSTEKTKDIINDLENKSKEIESIIQVITSISNQTNLLALNASIESARAGEHGRGFAVVADEIRQLSEQTKKAVGDISNIITHVVNNTMDAVDAMESSSSLVIDGMNVIKSAEQSTREVTVASEEMNAKISEIDLVTKDVAESSEKIVGIVESVEEISTTNLSELEEVTAASEQGLSDMIKLKDMVEKISRMSTELNDVVNLK